MLLGSATSEKELLLLYRASNIFHIWNQWKAVERWIEIVS